MRHSMRGAAAAVLAAVMCVTAPLSVFADEIIGPGANLGSTETQAASSGSGAGGVIAAPEGAYDPAAQTAAAAPAETAAAAPAETAAAAETVVPSETAAPETQAAPEAQAAPAVQAAPETQAPADSSSGSVGPAIGSSAVEVPQGSTGSVSQGGNYNATGMEALLSPNLQTAYNLPGSTSYTTALRNRSVNQDYSLPGTIQLNADPGGVDLGAVVAGAGLDALGTGNTPPDPIHNDVHIVTYKLLDQNGATINWTSTNAGDSGLFSPTGFSKFYMIHSKVARLYYRVYTDAHGWSPWCNSKETTPYNEDGTRIQAIQIRTKGYVHTLNDVYYKVVLNDGTVLDWAKNGQTTGTMGTDRYIVAIRVGFWHNTESFPYPQKNLMAGCQYEGVYKDSTGTHYSSWNGQPYTGWAFLDTTQYYFVNGEPARGWQYINGYKYYFYDDGSVATDLEPIMGLPGNYQINYNKATRTMYIMAADGDNGFIIPYKTFNSTCGPDTPDGDFSIYAKYGVKFMHDDIYCKYLNRFYNGFIIHSILFYNTSLELDAITYNYIDDAASGGCLRLLTGNSYWIYKNCGNGTRVHIYYDLWDKGPIEKDAIDYVIPREQIWDPSDPSSAEATAALQQAAKAEADVAAQVAAGTMQLSEEDRQLAEQLAASSQ